MEGDFNKTGMGNSKNQFSGEGTIEMLQTKYTEKQMNPLASPNLDFLNSFLDVYHNSANKTKRAISAKRSTEKKYEIHSYAEKFKVPSCTYITKNILPIVYICNCSFQSLVIICENCRETCHSGHTLYEIDNSKLNLTCNCGEENHEVEQDEGGLVNLEKKCLISSLNDFSSSLQVLIT